MSEDPRRHAPAVQRNREAILPVLRAALPDRGLLLEVASGSGEHAAYFAPKLDGWQWQPTDADPSALAGIDAHARDVDPKGVHIRPAKTLDAASAAWPVAEADAIFCANMIHIAPWAACEGLLRGAGAILAAGTGVLALYGPFIREDVATAESNLSFDQSLRGRDPEWGIRRLEDVAAAGARAGLQLEKAVEMPANNLTVFFRRG